MSQVPTEPQLADYPSRVHWLRAQAEWRLLSKVFKVRKAQIAQTGEQDAI
jgi:hypothetical protein